MQRDTAYGMETAEDEVMAEINVTPFIDIMLVMLIIFMITAPMMLGGVNINLPKAATGPVQRPQKPVVVSIDAEQRLFFGSDPITATDRIGFLKQAALESETGEVYLKGDGSVPYSVMMSVMAELGQAGFSRVILVTDATPRAQDTQTEAVPPAQAAGTDNTPGRVNDSPEPAGLPETVNTGGGVGEPAPVRHADEPQAVQPTLSRNNENQATAHPASDTEINSPAP